MQACSRAHMPWLHGAMQQRCSLAAAWSRASPEGAGVRGKNIHQQPLQGRASGGAALCQRSKHQLQRHQPQRLQVLPLPQRRWVFCAERQRAWEQRRLSHRWVRAGSCARTPVAHVREQNDIGDVRACMTFMPNKGCIPGGHDAITSSGQAEQTTSCLQCKLKWAFSNNVKMADRCLTIRDASLLTCRGVLPRKAKVVQLHYHLLPSEVFIGAEQERASPQRAVHNIALMAVSNCCNSPPHDAPAPTLTPACLHEHGIHDVQTTCTQSARSQSMLGSSADQHCDQAQMRHMRSRPNAAG